MHVEIALRYLHFISIFTITGALLTEAILIRNGMTRRELKRIVAVDAAYGVAAVVLLVAGFTLWLGGFGKPTAFYSDNWLFHLKLTLFLLVGLLSIYPTVFFLRNRKGDPGESVAVPSVVIWFVRTEVALLAVIPFLANLMAKGIGL